MVCVGGGVPSGGGEGGKGQLEETMTSSGNQGHGKPIDVTSILKLMHEVLVGSGDLAGS